MALSNVNKWASQHLPVVMLLYWRKSAYLCDTALAQGVVQETEVVLTVILTLCVKLHLGNVN